MTQCNGMNCSTTTGNHSPECRAEHTAAVAGGRFVKVVGDEREAFEVWCTSEGLNPDRSPTLDVYSYPSARVSWRAWQARAALSASTDVAAGDPFQARVQPWMMACFGAEISADRIERNHRFFEEAAELARIWTKVETIRAKQAAKPKHSPLPEAAPPVASGQKLTPAVRSALEACAMTYEMNGLATVGVEIRALLAASEPKKD